MRFRTFLLLGCMTVVVFWAFVVVPVVVGRGCHRVWQGTACIWTLPNGHQMVIHFYHEGPYVPEEDPPPMPTMGA